MSWVLRKYENDKALRQWLGYDPFLKKNTLRSYEWANNYGYYQEAKAIAHIMNIHERGGKFKPVWRLEISNYRWISSLSRFSKKVKK
mgnify:CR=1 FL=1